MGGARDRHPLWKGREEGSEARARSYQAARLGRPSSARLALHEECAKNATAGPKQQETVESALQELPVSVRTPHRRTGKLRADQAVAI